MILSAGDHVVADKSSIVGSIGVVFQKLKLKGLLEHFNVDHKHFATNEYIHYHSANYFKTFFLRLKMLIPIITSI
jgi:ClpP class serine protease